MFERILVCLDGSSLAEQILPHVTAVAQRFNSKILLLRVVTGSSTIAAAGMVTPAHDSETLAEEIEREENEAKAYLMGIALELKGKNLHVEWLILQGMAGNTIVSCAVNNKADLIAISTHGRSGLGRAVFGSVADFVLRQSGLPILVIKPQEKRT